VAPLAINVSELQTFNDKLKKSLSYNTLPPNKVMQIENNWKINIINMYVIRDTGPYLTLQSLMLEQQLPMQAVPKHETTATKHMIFSSQSILRFYFH